MFHDRTHAAFLLANALKKYQRTNTIVLAIPRGGFPVGYTIGHQLNLPLELVFVKKIGHPNNSEYAIGSVSSTELILGDTEGISDQYIKSEVKRLREMIKEKSRILLEGRSPTSLKGKTVILVDDGLATGNTMLASIEHIKKSRPKTIIVAVPVSSMKAHKKIEEQVDELICLFTSSDFTAVGQFYENFAEVTDEMVKELLAKSDVTMTETH